MALGLFHAPNTVKIMFCCLPFSSCTVAAARIAQWLALVNLNKLCSNGRAYPKTGLTLTGLTITAKNEAAERTSGTFQSESLADNFNERASLEATVAGVAALPEEVLRRLVAFCSL